MTRAFIMICLVTLLGACSDDDDTPATPTFSGQYLLVEQLIDPGDGSGTFSPVESEKEITFHANGDFWCSGNICDLSITADAPSAGAYSLTDSTLYPDDCPSPVLPYTFVIDGEFLIISYPCFEACKAKYERQF